jgi:dihydroorotate dehydrogenase (fumarate)
MDLTTTYLGMKLRTPLVPSASPLSDDLDNLKRMEDAGAAAVVLSSLFEEQLRLERYTCLVRYGHSPEDEGAYPKALSYLSEPSVLDGNTDAYLRHVSKAKASAGIPIIASLNGTTFGGWMSAAKQIQDAGADALELNLYSVPTNPDEQAEDVELSYTTILASVKAQLKIPVAVKLSPFYTNLAHFAQRLDQNGADGLVLFNRFYQPDIELDKPCVTPNLVLSKSSAMRLPLRWIALLRGRIRASLAATSGIHEATDAIKMIMAGADVTMLCSVLIKRGVGHLRVMEREMREWMEKHHHHSVEQLKGCMSHQNCPDPAAFERAQYMRAIRTFMPAHKPRYVGPTPPKNNPAPTS